MGKSKRWKEAEPEPKLCGKWVNGVSGLSRPCILAADHAGLCFVATVPEPKPKGGRPRGRGHWLDSESLHLLDRAKIELHRAMVAVDSARAFRELVDAELEAEKALHRVKAVMAKERALDSINRGTK